MSDEELLWGLIPTIAAIITILVSVYVAIGARRLIQFLGSSLVLCLNVLSLLVLYRIFVLGAWPSFLPHIAIGVSAIVATVQFTYRKCKNSAKVLARDEAIVS